LERSTFYRLRRRSGKTISGQETDIKQGPIRVGASKPALQNEFKAATADVAGIRELSHAGIDRKSKRDICSSPGVAELPQPMPK
jgi:hypothetical protein